MTQQPALQPHEQAVQRQQTYPRFQKQPGRGGGGGRGSGGGNKSDDDFSSDEVAEIFERLAKATVQFFSSANEFLITEQSAQHLLASTFETLANATRNGNLRAGLPKLVAGAAESRSETLINIGNRAKARNTHPIFDDKDSGGIIEKITHCLNPEVPR